MKTIELRVLKKNFGDKIANSLNGRKDVVFNRYIHVTCKPKIMFFLKKRKFEEMKGFFLALNKLIEKQITD